MWSRAGLPPIILAPAGHRDSFLAALAAGADAIYCGTTDFSARRLAPNFEPGELLRLIELAHAHNTQVYVTLNALMRPHEVPAVRHLIRQLNGKVRPDALIVQDVGLLAVVRQAGYRGAIHLSTLANCSFAGALQELAAEWVQKYGIRRVVLPRELNLDEIKTMAASCPPQLELEVFVHGALCYGVSGRCYWSSYLGGKSGLRGLCVQPCRRFYTQQGPPQRRFSCRDLSLDVLVRVLADIPAVRAWKIEGRKKGPHYVYYTVKAYQMLRDQGADPQARRDALHLLRMALGRDTTHGGFLPQRPQSPLEPNRQTASGLFIGKLQGKRDQLWLKPRIALLAGDILRVGYEDEPGHSRQRINSSIPAKGRYVLRFSEKQLPFAGTPVFLIDRREPALQEALQTLEKQLEAIPEALPTVKSGDQHTKAKRFSPARTSVLTVAVFRDPSRLARGKGALGTWLSEASLNACSPRQIPHLWWWLPPVLWPNEEAQFSALIAALLQHRVRQVVVNAPWQSVFFRDHRNVALWAGPFCNISNPEALRVLADRGFWGAIVSPELTRQDFLTLPANSPLPLGVVLSGHWPLGISRLTSEGLILEEPFQSPRQESAWAVCRNQNYWLYPNWRLDFRPHQGQLQRAGYKRFFKLVEPLPARTELKMRPGDWNWKHELV